MKTDELKQQAKDFAGAFSCDEGYYLFTESDLDNLLEAVAKAQRKDCANRGSHVSQQAHDYIIRTPLVTNK